MPRHQRSSRLLWKGLPALHSGEAELYLRGHFPPEPSVMGCLFSPFGNVAEAKGI